MTAVYAHMHDSTIRAEFERYCQTRVDVEGKLFGFDPDAVTADAEWVKHRLSRAADPAERLDSQRQWSENVSTTTHTTTHRNAEDTTRPLQAPPGR